MIFLDNITLKECRDKARKITTMTESSDLGISYFELLEIKYEIELCYAEKRIIIANPLLRYLR